MFSQPAIFDINPYEETSNSQHKVGEIGFDRGGNMYRYIQIGASNVSAGKLQVAPAPKTNHHNIAAAAAVTADNLVDTVTLTLGPTASTLNEYVGGRLVANDNDLEGESYTIIKNDAADASGTITIKVDRPFVSSITTSSQFYLVHNKNRGVVEAAVEEREPAGVPMIDMTASYFGWAMVKGETGVLAGDTLTLGGQVCQHASTAGAVDDVSTTFSTAFAYWVVGRAMATGVATEFPPVKLMID